MRKNVKRFFLIIIIFNFYCISVQDKPIVETPSCISSIFSLNRQIREIQIENRLIQTGIYFGAWGITWINIPAGIAFAFSGIYIQFRNKNKSDILIENWKINQCKIERDL